MRMKPIERKFAIAVVAAFVVQAWSPQLRGAVSGKVTEVAGQTVTVSVEGSAAPAIGDSVEIFFKLAGAEEEVSVASGKIISVEPGTVKVKVERVTGDVAKDQFARITSSKTNVTAESGPSVSPTSP